MNWREMEEEREGTVVIIIILEGENGSITNASTTRPIQLPILEIINTSIYLQSAFRITRDIA
jgi:hypothetical protein